MGMTRREAQLLALLAVVGFALRLAFVLATHGHTLIGDEVEYDSEGRFIAQGRWFWTLAPTQIPHVGLWKVPIYPTFVGLLYKLVGSHPDRVLVLQTLIGPLTITLTWLLARRLFGARVAFVAAAIVALCPFAWRYEVRLFAESLVTPLTLVFFILLLERRPTLRRAALVGAVCGVIVLTRPSAIYLLPVVMCAFVVAAGARRGFLLSAGVLLVAALTIAPWTIRNHSVSGRWVPLSVQDAAAYGTFNDDAANDPDRPYGWRIYNRRDAPLLNRARELGDVELRDRLRRNTLRYIRAHPSSVIEAFYWNGLTRLWDIRRPRHSLDEAHFNGHPRWFAAVGLATYWLVLPFALCALWLLRGRPAVLIPVVALAVSASVVFTALGATRYRAPFDPLIAVLASFGAVTILDAIRTRRGAAAAG